MLEVNKLSDYDITKLFYLQGALLAVMLCPVRANPVDPNHPP